MDNILREIEEKKEKKCKNFKKEMGYLLQAEME